MSTLSESLERLSAATSVKEVTLLRLSKELRAVGLWPKGKQGGGSFAAHAEAPHLVNMILGAAGTLPSDGPETVQLLRPLKFVARKPVGNAQPEHPGLVASMDLGKRLEMEISARAYDHAEQGKSPPLQGALMLSVSPTAAAPQARVTFKDEMGNGWSDEYAPAQGLFAHFMETRSPMPGLTRYVFIEEGVFQAAGELLADTIQHLADLKAPPPPKRPRGRPRKNPTPLAGDGASTDRPTRTMGDTGAPTGTLLTHPETTRERARKATSLSGKSARRSVSHPQQERLIPP